MLPQVWITRTRNIWVCHDLQYETKISIMEEDIIEIKEKRWGIGFHIYIYIYIYQCEKWSHITTMDINLRFHGYCRRKKLMTIIYLLVAVVSHSHFHRWRERFNNISDHSPNDKRIWHLCHERKGREWWDAIN